MKIGDISLHNGRHEYRLLIVLLFLMMEGAEILYSQEIDVEVEDTTSVMTVEDMSFLFDETKTKVGNDFFRMFHNKWSYPANVSGISVIIGEKPIPGMGTQIWIKAGETTLYKAVLRPNSDQMKKEVERALYLAYNYFINYEMIQQQLGSEDYKGNGLY